MQVTSVLLGYVVLDSSGGWTKMTTLPESSRVVTGLLLSPTDDVWMPGCSWVWTAQPVNQDLLTQGSNLGYDSVGMVMSQGAGLLLPSIRNLGAPGWLHGVSGTFLWRATFAAHWFSGGVAGQAVNLG